MKTPMRRSSALLAGPLMSVLAVVALVAACTHNLQLVPPPPTAAVTTTAGPWTSMIFAARTDSGVFVIDLGWGRASTGLRSVLSQINADTADVRWVFLTHAHRDHIGAWKSVTDAVFVMGREEVPGFVGESSYKGFGSRMGEFLNDSHRPHKDSVTIIALGGDTSFVFGQDTVRSYAVPGHTPGSTVYVFRQTLFAGDAANYGALAGFRGALRVYSDSVQQSQESMRALFARFDSSGVQIRTLCTAHGKCAAMDSALRSRVAR